MSNAVTQCGHLYHFRCIYEWSTRKQSCPLCKSANIKNIMVYCGKCFKERKEVGLRELPFMSLGELNAYKCVECRVKWSFVRFIIHNLSDFLHWTVLLLQQHPILFLKSRSSYFLIDLFHLVAGWRELAFLYSISWIVYYFLDFFLGS